MSALPADASATHVPGTDAALQNLGKKRDYTESTIHDRFTALTEANALVGRLRLAEGAAPTPEAAIALALETRSMPVPPPGIDRASSQADAG